MLKPRSGINSVQAYGCVHVWGGEEAAGVFPDHDVYDPDRLRGGLHHGDARQRYLRRSVQRPGVQPR